MQLMFSAVVFLVAMAAVSAIPAELSQRFGRFVSVCDMGDACLIQEAQAQDNNDTSPSSTSVDGLLFCCPAGNSLTITVSRDKNGYQRSQSTSFLSSDSVSGVFYSSDFSLGGGDGNSNNNNNNTRRVVCECRDIDVEAVESYYDDLRQRFWNTFDTAWNRISQYFP